MGFTIAAGLALFSILWALFHQPPVEQVAAQNLTQALNPVIWTPGPLTLVATGTVALLMGWGNTKTPPAMASLTVPAYYLNQVLTSNGIANVPLNSQTPSVLVEPGDGKVVIVSPNGTDSHGNPLVTLQSYNVAKNLTCDLGERAAGRFLHPIFPDGQFAEQESKPAGRKRLNNQDKMLQAVLDGSYPLGRDECAEPPPSRPTRPASLPPTSRFGEGEDRRAGARAFHPPYQ